MNSPRLFLSLSLLTALALASCSHFTGGTSQGGSNKVSFVLTANNPPLTLGLLAFRVVPTSITLTSSTNAQTTLNINNSNGFAYDLVRLQSDSAFLGTAASVPTGALTTVAISFSSVQLAFVNGTTFALTNPQCAIGAVCVATFAGPFTSSITTSQNINGNTGLGLQINVGNVMTITGTTLSLAFSNTNAATAFALPRQSSNLAANQLELIEDITGTVALNGTSVTVTSASAVNHQAITAITNSSTVLDQDPTLTLCASPTAGTISTCVSAGEAVSMDAVLNSDGTFTAQEIEPLLASPVVDTVEGTISSINSASQTQFTIVVTDIFPAATSSKIGSLSIGVPLTVNLGTAAFHVDSKGLPISGSFPTNYGTFINATNTTGLSLGQEVAIHVPSFTAASGTTPASASGVDSVTLRWSRFIAAVDVPNAQQFTVNVLPTYFGFSPSSIFSVEIFGGTQGTRGVTNLDGITSGSSPAGSPPVGIRGLFIENPTNTLIPQFFAAKIRQR
jgi:hypothetical protein